MSEEVFGIPSQTIMDMLTLITNDTDENTGVGGVIHCNYAGIIYTATGSGECVAVNSRQYPNWKCSLKTLGIAQKANNHHSCYQANKIIIPKGYAIYYCVCKKAPQYKDGLVIPYSESPTYNYTLMEAKGINAFCYSCRNHL
jgi:hypothetical protein